LGSMFLVVPLFHLAVSSVQLTPVMLFLAAYSIFHNKAPTWLQESPKPAIHVHQTFSTVPSFVQTTYASFVLLTVCDERTFAFKTNVKFCPHYHFESNCNFVNSSSFSFLPHQVLSTWLNNYICHRTLKLASSSYYQSILLFHWTIWVFNFSFH
jgi:hypothetical protein